MAVSNFDKGLALISYSSIGHSVLIVTSDVVTA